MADFQTPRQSMYMGAPEDYEYAERIRMGDILEAFGLPQGALIVRDPSTVDIHPDQIIQKDGQYGISEILHEALDEWQLRQPPFIQTERSRRALDKLSDYEQMLMMGEMMAPSGSPKR